MTLPTSMLHNGTNTIAVEVHNKGINPGTSGSTPSCASTRRRLTGRDDVRVAVDPSHHRGAGWSMMAR